MSRRAARVTALQALFQVDVAGIDPNEALAHVLGEFPLPERSKPFATDIMEGTLQKLGEIDNVIKDKVRDWKFERLARVDRTILRLALYEILFRPDIPPNVTINEALEMAKLFSSEDSSVFINGILGSVVEEQKMAGKMEE